MATGTVTFLDGTTTLGTGTLNASGAATFSTTTLTAGTYSITASYGGDSKDAASVSQAVTVTVTSTSAAQSTVATTTTLMASATQLTVGQSVTFTGTVVPASGSTAATGIVTFLDGSTSLGTGQLNASGVATFSTTSLAVGAHSISAGYSGDSSHSPSTSTAITVNIAGAVTPAYAMVLSSSSLEPYSRNAIKSDSDIGSVKWVQPAYQLELLWIASGHNLQIQSRQSHSQRRAGEQHGDSHAPDSTGALTQAGSAWCARGTTGLRLGDAVGIHLVVGPQENAQTITDRPVVVPAGGGGCTNRSVIVGLWLRVLGEHKRREVYANSYGVGIKCRNSHFTGHRARSAVS